MPGNIIRINNSNELEWYVGDSKMEELIKFLNKVGIKQHPIDRIKGPPQKIILLRCHQVK